MAVTTKDQMILFRSTIKGTNSKGGARTQLYLDPENVQTLIETLTALAGSPNGVKFDIHTNQKEANGRKFDSSFAFVKAVDAGVRTKTTFVPKDETTAAKVAQFAAKQVK